MSVEEIKSFIYKQYEDVVEKVRKTEQWQPYIFKKTNMFGSLKYGVDEDHKKTLINEINRVYNDHYRDDDTYERMKKDCKKFLLERVLFRVFLWEKNGRFNTTTIHNILSHYHKNFGKRGELAKEASAAKHRSDGLSHADSIRHIIREFELEEQIKKYNYLLLVDDDLFLLGWSLLCEYSENEPAAASMPDDKKNYNITDTKVDDKDMKFFPKYALDEYDKYIKLSEGSGGNNFFKIFSDILKRKKVIGKSVEERNEQHYLSEEYTAKWQKPDVFVSPEKEGQSAGGKSRRRRNKKQTKRRGNNNKKRKTSRGRKIKKTQRKRNNKKSRKN